MSRFLACAIVFAVVPMSLLNPIGRPAFLGYYLGIATLWLAIMAVNYWSSREGKELR